ncbi:MAG: tetratricopeptide repeat protein [Candidatus Cloacimonetes bacterium]|nr:tetratricopeptide repeat protein [Candidatus Cloacimonadota bacterium]
MDLKKINELILDHIEKGEINSGLEIVQNNLRELESVENSPIKAQIYLNIGKLYYESLQFDIALEYYHIALKICEEINDLQLASGALSNIGVIYSALELSDKAMEYYRLSIEKAPDNIKAINNLGDKYMDTQQYEKALDQFETAHRIAIEQNDELQIADSIVNIGNVQLMQNKPEEALGYFARIDERKNVSARTRFFGLLGKARAYLKLSRHQEARMFLEETLREAQKNNNYEMYYFVYELYVSYSKEIADWKSCYEYSQKFYEIKEKLNQRTISQRIAELEAAYAIERKQMEAQKLIERSARMASIGVMTAGITHEINQPLNAIVINADGLLFKDNRDKVLPEDYRASIEKIFLAAQRVDKIIKHMRTFWNTGNEVIMNQTVYLNKSIEDALSLMNQQIRSHGITLIKNFSPQNPAICGNKVHIEQIIINLLTNSIQALDDAKKQDKSIIITSKVVNDQVLLEIEDNGTGLKNENMDKIFDPMYSTKSPQDGMGLGLAIVQNYITQMKGTISCCNKDAEGVIFSITLPLVKE